MRMSAFDIDYILEKDAFKQLEPAQIDGLKAVMEKIKGKTSIEAMPVIVGFAQTLQAAKPIPPQTQRAMLEAILSAMSEDERDKFMAMLKMAKEA